MAPRWVILVQGKHEGLPGARLSSEGRPVVNTSPLLSASIGSIG
jgi:hypothetical protein